MHMDDVIIDPDKIATFQHSGYTLVPGLFCRDEINRYREHFKAINLSLRAEETSTVQGVEFDADSMQKRPIEKIVQNNAERSYRTLHDGAPLAVFPRIMQPHRYDQLSLSWLLDLRIRTWLKALLGRDPYAVQTMYYFKPPGARGQALHQDQYYLQVQPGTCVAAWMAVDHSDTENGCLQVVPGSQDLPVLCTEKASLEESFIDTTVPLPDGMTSEPIIMNPGDVLFFNGQIIHGSLPNTSDVCFRQSLIGHYIVGEARKVAEHYFPVLDMDGQEVNLDVSEGGGPCGVWVGEEGSPRITMKSGTTL